MRRASAWDSVQPEANRPKPKARTKVNKTIFAFSVVIWRFTFMLLVKFKLSAINIFTDVINIFMGISVRNNFG